MLDAQLSTFTKQLSIDLGFSEVPTENEKGAYPFDFGDALVIFIESLHPGFYFTARLGSPPSQCEELYSLLMFANLFGQGTGNAVIGLDEEGKTLILSLALPYQMPYTQFKEHVEEFVNHVDLWQKKISDASASQNQPSNLVG